MYRQKPSGGRVVLMYHRMGLPRLGSLVAGQYVAPALFRSQLGVLTGRGWKCWGLGEIIKNARRSDGGAADEFAVTFDDGYASVYDHAFPSLAERGMTATVYVVASTIGGTNEWDQRLGDRIEPMMSAGQIKRMADSGFEIGSHGLAHAHLPALADSDLAREMRDSKHLLEDITGRPVVSFSYPYGEFDRRVAEAAEAAGYLNAVSTRLGALTRAGGEYEIPRINVRWNAFGPHLMKEDRPGAEGKPRHFGSLGGIIVSELRVLEAITPSRIGGAEVYTAALCRRLPSMGARVELFCPAGRPFVQYAVERGIKSINWKTFGKVDPLTVIRLTKLLRQTRSNVIHTHLSTASLLGAFAAKRADRPSVAHVHGMNSATCYRRSTAIIAVSDVVKWHLSWQGIDEDKVHVVHNGVDLDYLQPMRRDDARRECALDPEAPIFGVFGRLAPEKGQMTAIRALSIFLEDHDSRAILLVVGEGDDREHLGALVKELEIGKSVKFLGFRPDVRKLMSACDAVIVPSDREGFGLAAAEAMALQRPVIGSAVGGLECIIVAGDTGYLVGAGDPQAFANAMAYCVEDRAVAECMGRSGRRRVEEHFEINKQIAKTLEILRSVR